MAQSTFKMATTCNGQNLLLWEQILSIQSWPLLQREKKRNVWVTSPGVYSFNLTHDWLLYNHSAEIDRFPVIWM